MWEVFRKIIVTAWKTGVTAVNGRQRASVNLLQNIAVIEVFFLHEKQPHPKLS